LELALVICILPQFLMSSCWFYFTIVLLLLYFCAKDALLGEIYMCLEHNYDVRVDTRDFKDLAYL